MKIENGHIYVCTESIRATAEAAIERAADWAIDSGWIRNDIDDLADIIYLLLPIVEAGMIVLASAEYATGNSAYVSLSSLRDLAKAWDALEASTVITYVPFTDLAPETLESRTVLE